MFAHLFELQFEHVKQKYPHDCVITQAYQFQINQRSYIFTETEGLFKSFE